MKSLEELWREDEIQSYLKASRRTIVAFSGGADSLCLLSLAAALDNSILALHVNHGLHADADKWEQLCRQHSEKLGIMFESFKVKVEIEGSIEENARKARYEIFEKVLQDNELLLLAHHADDQIETVLFNLFRGTSIPGIIAMPRVRKLGKAKLFRPLLGVSRKHILEYCKMKGLRWIDDPSNRDQTFDRGYLRHSLIPMIEARWPKFRTVMLKGVGRDDGLRQLIENVAENDLIDCQSRWGLSSSEVLKLTNSRRDSLLRHWLAKEGLPQPSSGVLRALYTDVLMAKPDSEPCIPWSGCEIRRFKDNLILETKNVFIAPKDPINFDPSSSLKIAGGNLRTVQEKGSGLRSPGIDQKLLIKFREGGEFIRIDGKTKTLKKVLQELGVPPWVRDRLPLIYLGDTLVAIPGITSWSTLPIVVSDQKAKSREDGLLFWFDSA